MCPISTQSSHHFLLKKKETFKEKYEYEESVVKKQEDIMAFFLVL